VFLCGCDLVVGWLGIWFVYGGSMFEFMWLLCMMDVVCFLWVGVVLCWLFWWWCGCI